MRRARPCRAASAPPRPAGGGGRRPHAACARGARTRARKWAGVSRVATPRWPRASRNAPSTNPWSVLADSCGGGGIGMKVGRLEQGACSVTSGARARAASTGASARARRARPAPRTSTPHSSARARTWRLNPRSRWCSSGSAASGSPRRSLARGAGACGGVGAPAPASPPPSHVCPPSSHPPPHPRGAPDFVDGPRKLDRAQRAQQARHVALDVARRHGRDCPRRGGSGGGRRRGAPWSGVRAVRRAARWGQRQAPHAAHGILDPGCCLSRVRAPTAPAGSAGLGEPGPARDCGRPLSWRAGLCANAASIELEQGENQVPRQTEDKRHALQARCGRWRQRATCHVREEAPEGLRPQGSSQNVALFTHPFPASARA